MTVSLLFWALALALVGATLTALLWPLFRRRHHTGRGAAAAAAARGDEAGAAAQGNEAAAAQGDEAAATAIFRDHQRQIDADYTAGLIGNGERETAMAELVTRFGSELAQLEPERHALRARSQRVAGVALLIIIPVAALVMYAALGNPQAMNPDVARPTTTPAQMTAMVEELHERMKANPVDGNGWALLGRSYLTLGRFAEAVEAFARASERLPASAALLADQAEASALAQGERLAGQPVALLERALALDPKHPKTLALLATAAIEQENLNAGIGYWQRLRAVVPEGSADRARIDEVLAELEARRVSAARGKAAPTEAMSGSKGAGSNAAGSKSVEGSVEIAPALASNVGPGDTLFIFARDPDGGRMPLAAIKLAAGKWPQRFRLTDEMSMAPGAVLSTAQRIVVEARVSKTGSATPAGGDLSGKSAPVAPGARDVRVVLDRVVP